MVKRLAASVGIKDLWLKDKDKNKEFEAQGQ